jgi:RimJ/RimL family protein N-acetyltransferase
LENDKCIGYGGLVHINWTDKNAEISFIIDTCLEKDFFHKHWGIYLDLLEQAAFTELNLHKIYTYAFDLRPHLYEAIEEKGYKKEAFLKEHCYVNGEFKDVVIHSKIKSTLFLREVTIGDANLLFEWANDDETRGMAIVKKKISWSEHINWLTNKLKSNQSYIYVLTDDENKNIGVIRFDKNNDVFAISYSIDKLYRKKGMGLLIIQLGIEKILESEPICKFVASVQTNNIASNKIFEKLGFRLEKTENIKGNIFNVYCKDENR